MAYAIMRFEKLKAAGIGSLAGSLAHTFRSRYTPNADPELVKDNRVWLGPSDPQEVADAIRERWPDKHRKDAVGCIEYFIGASPEWFEKHGGSGDQERYFQGAIDWLKAEFGEENVISVVQHNDETTPHLAAYVVPIDPVTGRLNAKRWTGGRGVCSEMQSSFHKAAGEPAGLDRGQRGSTAHHTSIKAWYEEQSNVDKRKASLEESAARVIEQAAHERREAELLAAQAQRDREIAEGVESRLAKRERAAQKREAEMVERERRLAALERELQERGESLAGGEAALVKRQREIDAAGEQLRQRLAAARQQQQAWEARRDAWLAENRPPAEVPELVRKLQRLRSMSRFEAAEFIDTEENDELFAWYNPIDGYTQAAEALLAKYEGTAEQLERWERTVEPPSGGGPSM